MMSLLDQAIANTGGPRVTYEQNDRDQINFGNAPARDPGERGATKEEALRTANLATGTNGKIAVLSVGIVPWHGLGTVIDRAPTSAEALRLSGLDFEVRKIACEYQHNGQMVKSKMSFAVIRTDSGAQLGSVGSRYQVMSNADAFSFMDSVCDMAKWETAGAMGGGETVWMLAKMPECRFEVESGDAVEPYVLLSNSHDGSSAIRVLPTAVRVVCANTHRAAMKGKAKGISIRHTASAKGKVREAQAALGLAKEEFLEYGEAAKTLACKDVSQQIVGGYFQGILDEICDITQADSMKGANTLAAAVATTIAEREHAKKRFQRQIEQRRDLLTDILDRWESERCPKNAWGMYNAVSEHVDHGPQRYQGNDRKRAEARFESLTTGRGDRVKQIAFQRALSV